MNNSDWGNIFENRLYEGITAAIDSFSKEHPDEEVCYFALDSEPECGYVLTCFNTQQNSTSFAEKEAARTDDKVANKEWLDWLQADEYMKNRAYSLIRSKSLLPFCNNTGDFKYQGYTAIDFDEWEEYAESVRNKDETTDKDEDDYLIRNAALLFWQVLNKVVSNGEFSKLKLSSSLLVGFNFHDDEMVMTRILYPTKNP